jgi:hypothetical protein
MRPRKPLQQFLSAAGQLEQDLAMIDFTSHPPDQAFLLQPVAKLHGAMVLYLKPLCQSANCRGLVRRQAVDGKKRLVLVRLNTCVSRCPFTEIQKAANFVAKVAQRLKSRRVMVLVGHLLFFVLYRNTI